MVLYQEASPFYTLCKTSLTHQFPYYNEELLISGKESVCKAKKTKLISTNNYSLSWSGSAEETLQVTFVLVRCSPFPNRWVFPEAAFFLTAQH